MIHDMHRIAELRMRQSSEVKIDANRHLKIWECTMKMRIPNVKIRELMEQSCFLVVTRDPVDGSRGTWCTLHPYHCRTWLLVTLMMTLGTQCAIGRVVGLIPITLPLVKR